LCFIAGVAFPYKIISPLSEPSEGSDYTIEKKLEPANKRTAVAESEEVVLNNVKGPSVTDQIGRGAEAQTQAILAAFNRPVFTTSSDVHVPLKRTITSKQPKKQKKNAILQKLQYD